MKLLLLKGIVRRLILSFDETFRKPFLVYSPSE